MATTQDLLNKVLIGLRQSQITDTSTTDAYELLVLQYVNEAKEEIEESWDWNALRTTLTVTLAASTVQYTLTSAGDADADTTDRTRLLYERSSPFGSTYTSNYNVGDLPQVFDTTDSAEYRLKQMSLEEIERLHLTDEDETRKPTHFAIWSDGTSLKMKVYPTPDAVRTLKVRVVQPQAELASTDLTTTLSIPPRPVWMLALHKANEERGSELSRPGGPTELAARDALATAISREQTAADYSGSAV